MPLTCNLTLQSLDAIYASISKKTEKVIEFSESQSLRVGTNYSPHFWDINIITFKIVRLILQKPRLNQYNCLVNSFIK